MCRIAETGQQGSNRRERESASPEYVFELSQSVPSAGMHLGLSAVFVQILPGDIVFVFRHIFARAVDDFIAAEAHRFQ